jgi:hypothetical protein
MRKVFVVFATVVACSSCASIVSKSSTEFRIDSSPKDAAFQVFDRKGLEIYNGHTPSTVRLKHSSGYFKRAEYRIKFTRAGYLDKEITVSADINGWYFGNIVFGGLIGFLIVDPATGAMYKLDRKEVNETLGIDPGSKTSATGATLNLLTLQEIPENMRSRLVEIK